MTKTYLFHELSSIFPLIEGEEFNELVEDIKKNGQLEEGILFEDKILDGRNRYRACKLLNIPFKTKEYSGQISARDYIISTNLHRRHLTIAQRSEIGLILLAEEEKKARERKAEINSEIGKSLEGKKRDEPISEIKKNILEKKIEEIKKEKGEGASLEIVAPKVKVSSVTLSKAKKIKDVAKTEPIIAKEWEEAKKGKTSVDAVYKKAKIIETLPNDVKKEAIKENPKITLEEAKKIAEFPELEQRKNIMKQIEQTKQASKKIIERKKEIAKHNTKSPVIFENLDEKFLKKWRDIAQDIQIKMRKGFLKPYSEETKQEAYKIVKGIIKFLISEFSEEVKIIGEN